MKHYQHFIDNQACGSTGADSVAVIDPSDGQRFASLARGTSQDIDAAVNSARFAYEGRPQNGSPRGEWGQTTAAQRSRLLLSLAEKLNQHQDELAALESRDTGKPIRQGKADAAALGRYFEYYGGAADKLHGQTLPYQNGYTVLTIREPHGVTGHIIPWNYPMQIFGRTVGAALAAGNACVVKPAEDACLSLLRVAELAADVGLPAGALNIVTGLGNEAGQALAEHPGIDHISFTGSGPTGQKVAQAAGQRHCPVTMELGGKSAQVVFADSDLNTVVPIVVNAIIQNGGQTCSAGSRVLVERSIYPAMLERLSDVFNGLTTGPSDADKDIGPLINARQLGGLQAALARAQEDGIRIAAQGQLVNDAPAGGFYQTAVLMADVPPSHDVAQLELFGPVLCAMPFDSESDAVRLANGTNYGLVTGLWTADGARQMRLARQLRSGQVFVNNYGAGGGVELPFGGMKHSGHGREKGFEALYGFTTLKTIALKHD